MEPDNLIQQIHDFFLSQYNGSLTGTNTFLAFEPLGLMISPNDFQFNGSFNATVAQQQVSIMADTVPAISDIFEPDAFNKISDQYGQLVGDGENMVGTLEFCDANIDPSQTDQYLAYFGFLKKIAQQKFSQTGEQASILDPSAQVATCNVTPSTWYDPTSPIWQQKTFQSATPATSSTATLTAPVLNWKLGLNLQKTPVTGTVYTTLNTHLKLLNIAPEPAATTQPTATVTIAPANRVMMERPMALNMRQAQTVSAQPAQPVHSDMIMARPVITQAAPLMLNKGNYSALRTAVPFSQMVNVNRVIGLNNNAVTQPVNSSQFSVNFSYSLVRFERDWMYQPLIDKASIWYSLTNLAGDYSTGKNSADNKGLLRCIPKAMIVVKDLDISAQWSAADIQMASSSFGFGCFNISNSPPITSASQQLSAPGIQVIAWICEVIPQLPVNNDPGMVGASTVTAPTSTTGTTTTDTSTGTQTTPTGGDNTETDTSTGTSTAHTTDSSDTSTNTSPTTTSDDIAPPTPVTADSDTVSQPQATN
jgi:hypothetical protein